MSQPADTTNPPAPRWQRRPQERPEEILDAAFDVFGEQGFARTRLEEVAQRAGVSKGTLYLYFDSKETLFREMVRAKAVAALREAEAFVEGFQGTNRDLLITFLRRMYRVLRQQNLTRISRLVQAELGSFPELAHFYTQEVILPARRLMETIIVRGVASGEFRETPLGFASRAVPMLLIHAAQTQCFFQRFDPEALSDEETLDGVIDFCLSGVLARPEPQR
ncbi:MAG TPA: TetR/AcrR family transcriptional regulator [Gemmatimonadales bacterium]|nr:TetR/AcrR family transcriptional regulator [Gemmatimonadales bacterium]